MEAKIVEILKRIDPSCGEAVIAELDEAYTDRHTDARHAHHWPASSLL